MRRVRHQGKAGNASIKFFGENVACPLRRFYVRHSIGLFIVFAVVCALGAINCRVPISSLFIGFTAGVVKSLMDTPRLCAKWWAISVGFLSIILSLQAFSDYLNSWGVILVWLTNLMCGYLSLYIVVRLTGRL